MSTDGYSLLGYASMVADRGRMSAYRSALCRAITPGCTVIDLGTGIGATAVLASQLGAGHVIAIDPAEAIALGPLLARANGDIDNITWLQDVSTNVTLDERADVLVSDLRGVLPLHGNHIPTLIDARARLIKDGGTLIPLRDVMYLSLVSSEKRYEAYQERWDAAWLDIDLSPARARSIAEWVKARVEVSELFVPAHVWAEFDYASIQSPDVRGAVQWDIERHGLVHGIAAWFDTELVAGIGYSNAPGAPEHIYGQAFFPLEQPLELGPGDRVQVDLRAHLRGDGYVWIWCVDVYSGPARTRRRSMRHSTLGELRRIDEQRSVRLSDSGHATRAILDRLARGDSIAAVVDWLSSADAVRPLAREHAVHLVDDLARRYGAA